MCLIVFESNTHPDYRLVLGANRDEFYERPTDPARFWSEAPYVLAGRDRKAGGTWMGVTRHGYWAAITNVRDLEAHDPEAPSRGRLVADFLIEEPHPADYLQAVSEEADEYNGFNLLVGSPAGIWYLSNYDSGLRKVEPGVHGLSNHLLDTSWPKVDQARDQLRQATLRQSGELRVGGGDDTPPEAGDARHPHDTDGTAPPDPVDVVLDLLDDRDPFPDEHLPDTGVGKEKERMLSPLFIDGDQYGTRSSTVLLIGHDGHVTFAEKTYREGMADATRRFTFEVQTEAVREQQP